MCQNRQTLQKPNKLFWACRNVCQKFWAHYKIRCFHFQLATASGVTDGQPLTEKVRTPQVQALFGEKHENQNFKKNHKVLQHVNIPHQKANDHLQNDNIKYCNILSLY